MDSRGIEVNYLASYQTQNFETISMTVLYRVHLGIPLRFACFVTPGEILIQWALGRCKTHFLMRIAPKEVKNSQIVWHCHHVPAVIYLLKVNNRNTRTRFEICSKLTIKTPWRRSGVFTVNFEHISQLLLFLLLTCNCQLGPR